MCVTCLSVANYMKFVSLKMCEFSTPMASFTKEVDWRLAKCPLVFNGHLANRQLTSLVKEATGGHFNIKMLPYQYMNSHYKD